MGWLAVREPVSTWTHALWLLLSLPGTWVLWRLCRGDRVKQLGMLVFGLSLALCYAGSSLYHAVPAELADEFNVLDHIGIYVLIAGTVTPIGLVVLRGWWRTGLLCTIWLMALTGIVLRLATELPLALRTSFYLAMGWVGCVTYFELARHLSHRGVRLIWLGGLLYSAGAVINLVGWPELWPPAFEAHELFHLFVMAGSLCHYYFMLTVVVPFGRTTAPVARGAARTRPRRERAAPTAAAAPDEQATAVIEPPVAIRR
jgi:hemolysin III